VVERTPDIGGGAPGAGAAVWHGRCFCLPTSTTVLPQNPRRSRAAS
jgi:hypothetical protein